MSRREFLTLATVAMTVRAVGWLALDYQLTGDARTYQLLATNLAEHAALSLSTTEPYLPSALRPPLYPALISLVQAVTRSQLIGVQVVQLLLSVAASVMLAVVARRRVGGRAGRLASWALVLNPFDGPFVAAMLTEVASTFLVAASVTSLALLRGSRRFLLAGLFAGLAALTRDLFLVWPAVLAGFVVARGLRGRARVRRLRQAALVVAGAVAVIAPWSLRNAVQFGRLIPVATGGLEYNAWIGTWEQSPDWIAGGVINYPPEAFPTPEHRARLEALNGELYDEAARAVLREMAVLNWRRDPLKVVWRCLRRAPLTWLGTRSEIFKFALPGVRDRGSLPWKVMKASQWGLNAVFVGLGLAFLVLATWLGPRAQWLRWIIAAPPVVTALAYLPMHSVESRYSQPVLQLLILGGGAGAGLAVTRVLARRRAARD